MKKVFFPNLNTFQDCDIDRRMRARTLLRATKLALQQFQGREISFDQLGFYAAQAASTAHDKLEKADHPQLEALIGWLERLPEDVRGNLVNHACRVLPTLAHPHLTHDQVQITALKSLLRQGSGLALIVGPNPGLRTWLITALGHGSVMLGADHRLVTGVDRHPADWFVPVEGVNYLQTPLTLSPSQESIARAWDNCKQSHHAVVLLNCILSLAPALRMEVLALAGTRNVFVADDASVICDWFAKYAPRTIQPRIITVELADRDRIQTRIEPLKLTQNKKFLRPGTE